MKSLLLIVACVLSGLAGCNYTIGECWPRDQNGPGDGLGGAGGSILVPAGVGGFGDVPPGPQGADAEGAVDVSGCNAVAGFSASLFNFKTTLEDDGKDEGGGEQEASAKLKFIDSRPFIPEIWTCDVTIKMPLRTAKRGTVSAKEAAKIAAKITTRASTTVMHSQSSWQPTLFCSKFGNEMQNLFNHDPEFKGLGGRASARR